METATSFSCGPKTFLCRASSSVCRASIMVGALTSLAEAQVLRLSLIYALLDGERLVRVPHLLAALSVWDYCETSVKYIFGQTLGDPVADGILETL